MKKSSVAIVVAVALAFAFCLAGVPLHASTGADKEAKNQADALYKAGRYAEAEPHYKRALELREAEDGKDSLPVAQSLGNLAVLYRAMGRYTEAEPLNKRALEIRETKLGKDHPDVAQSVNNLGLLYYHMGRYAEAEELFTRSLGIWEKKPGKDNADLALGLNNLGLLYSATGRYKEAETVYKRSLEMREAGLGKDHPDVARCLNNLGMLYYHAGRYAEAEPLFEQSLSIWEKKLGKDHLDVALSLNNLALLYRALGRDARAEPLYKRSLEIREAKLGKNHPSIALSLNNLAMLYCASGRYAEAEPMFRRSLEIWEARLGKDHPDVAMSLANLGNFYRLLGRYSEAEPLYKRALAIREAKLGKDHPAVAGNLMLLGVLYRTTARYAEAEQVYKRSLAIREAKLGKDHPTVSVSLNNLAFLYYSSGRYAEAEPLYKRSLEIRELKLGRNNPGLAVPMNNLALLYRSMKKYPEAEALLKRALPLAESGRSPETLRCVQESYARLLAGTRRREAAVFFAKQAVNTTQGLRREAAMIDKETLDAYQGKVESIYKYLSNLLIEAGRFSEAQQVLDLLKNEEYSEFTVRDALQGDETEARATLTSEETALEARYSEAAGPLAKLGAERGALLGKSGRSEEEDSRLAVLDKELEKAGGVFEKALDEIAGEFSTKRQDKVEEVKEAQGLQEDLRELGQGTVALYTLVGEEKFHVLLIAPDFRKAFQVPVTEKDLNRKIMDFLGVVKDPRRDPLPLAKELYDIIFAPVAQDLKDLNTETLMWSLDGALRYLPLAALYDGERFLAEKYRSVMFTPASKARLLSKPSAEWKGLGLGVSKAYPGFDPLPAVRGELSGIFRQAEGTTGVLPGLVNLDDAFTLEAMKEGLRKRYPLVHIASHFVFTPGDDTKSYLLLGDGRRLPLSDIKIQNNLFGGVELLTLSACNTAVGGGKGREEESGAGDGKEVESFGVLAQRQGAKGVIATLWQVADDSTGLFMQYFYQLRQKEKLTKAEALRRTQTMFIQGRLPERQTVSQGMKVVPAEPEGKMNAGPCAHPYFWAPFLLIGNWL